MIIWKNICSGSFLVSPAVGFTISLLLKGAWWTDHSCGKFEMGEMWGWFYLTTGFVWAVQPD